MEPSGAPKTGLGVKKYLNGNVQEHVTVYVLPWLTMNALIVSVKAVQQQRWLLFQGTDIVRNLNYSYPEAQERKGVKKLL